MKTKIYQIILTLMVFFAPSLTHAAGQDDLPAGILSGNMCITTYTSEPCGDGSMPVGTTSGNSPSNQLGRYACTVCWANAFIEFISGIYKYIFFISMIIGVLVIVALGLSMSLSGMANTEEMRESAKYRIMSILWGLMGMALIPWILKTVAPFFFQ